MNWNTLLALFPLATLISVFTSYLIPYLSALVSRTNNWWTGLVTIVLSGVSGFLSEWAAQGSNFNWKGGLLTMVVNCFIAWGTHEKWLKGSEIEAKLFAFPRTRIIGGGNAAPPVQHAA